MSNAWIRVAYSVLLGLIVALTVGFGVAMVYPGPKQPDTPSLTFAQLQSGGNNQQDADRLVATVDRFYQDAYDFRRAYPAYQRNMFLALTGLAIIVGAVGLALPAAVNFLRLGLTLGAGSLLAAATYLALKDAPNPATAAAASFAGLLAAGSPPGLDFAGRFLRFAISFIGLLALLFVGIWRLTDWAPRPTARTTVAPTPSPFAPPVAPTPGVGETPLAPPELSAESRPWQRPNAD